MTTANVRTVATPRSGYSFAPPACSGMRGPPGVPQMVMPSHGEDIPIQPVTGGVHWYPPGALPPLIANPPTVVTSQFPGVNMPGPQYVNAQQSGYPWQPYYGGQPARTELNFSRPFETQQWGVMSPRQYHDYHQGRERNHYGHSFSKGPKLEFPKFDGDNPEAWIRKAEKCFELSKTPIEEMVQVAEIYFTGRADQWMSSNNIDTSNMNWNHFCNLICKRFAAEGRIGIADTFRS